MVYLHESGNGLSRRLGGLVAGPPPDLGDKEATGGLRKTGRIFKLCRNNVWTNGSEYLEDIAELRFLPYKDSTKILRLVVIIVVINKKGDNHNVVQF